MINIKVFDLSLLKIDKKSYKSIGIYNIGHITIKKNDDYENINSVNPLYLIIGEVIKHIEHSSTEEKNGSKYLVFDLSDENKEVLKNYSKLWDGIKNKFEVKNYGECNSIETIEYEKDFRKIDSNDDLPLNKPLKFPTMTIVVKSLFKEDKFYPQVYLGECLYKL